MCAVVSCCPVQSLDRTVPLNPLVPRSGWSARAVLHRANEACACKAKSRRVTYVRVHTGCAGCSRDQQDLHRIVLEQQLWLQQCVPQVSCCGCCWHCYCCWLASVGVPAAENMKDGQRDQGVACMLCSSSHDDCCMHNLTNAFAPVLGTHRLLPTMHDGVVGLT